MLLKLSSANKFSQNLKRYEDDSSSTPPFDIYLPYIYKAFRYCQNWCGLLLFYPYQRQCEKPVSEIKQIVFPHLFLSMAHCREQVSIKVQI